MAKKSRESHLLSEIEIFSKELEILKSSKAKKYLDSTGSTFSVDEAIKYVNDTIKYFKGELNAVSPRRKNRPAQKSRKVD